jgi:ubiquinone/menaquinone biosynthesis C-methylase UbiE
MRVLDVGSGSGDVAFLAARMVGPGGRVIGTDRAVEAVTRASGRVKAVGLENVEFLLGDPTEMKFDQPFDAVIGRLVLMYYPDPASAS